MPGRFQLTCRESSTLLHWVTPPSQAVYGQACPPVGWMGPTADAEVLLGVVASDIQYAARAYRDWCEALELPLVVPASRVGAGLCILACRSHKRVKGTNSGGLLDEAGRSAGVQLACIHACPVGAAEGHTYGTWMHGACTPTYMLSGFGYGTCSGVRAIAACHDAGERRERRRPCDGRSVLEVQLENPGVQGVHALPDTRQHHHLHTHARVSHGSVNAAPCRYLFACTQDGCATLVHGATLIAAASFGCLFCL